MLDSSHLSSVHHLKAQVLLIFMVVGWYLALRQVVNFHKEIILPSSTPSRSVERLSCEVNYLPPYADEELEVSGLVGQLPFRVPMLSSLF